MFESDILSSTIILTVIVRMAVFILIVPLHESAHGLVAHWFGDDTAKDAGRVTLNPFAHLDIAGFVIMLILGVGWAKPVPVNPSKFRKRRLGMAMVSLAGPLSNLIAAFLGAVIFMVVASAAAVTNISAIEIGKNTSLSEIAALFTYYFVSINISLAVFNLIPLPPLDGFNILRSFMPVKFDIWVFRNYRAINTAFIILLILSTRIYELQIPYLYARSMVEFFIWLSVSWIPGLFGI
ncbi:site-2 protease family protein [Ruminococcus sp.]|uniref:site-2 protease family protein n=1 Tax=Ruminococcus sp. TaxID=41978 RepID=UPI0025EDED8D|nr:site-2 protease family protein [Ruminococcus sp.]MCR4639136.1 site-2 protease family protein [Ruminococcus sp.]